MIRIVPFAVAVLLLQSASGGSLPDPAVQAVYDNNIPNLKGYLKAGGDPNAVSGRDNSLLMYAAAYGTLDSLKLLLDGGADPNHKNSFGATALMWSVADSDKVKLLLARGADPNLESKSKRTALLLAALQGDGGRSVKILAANGAKPGAVDDAGLTIVSAGASSGNIAAVRLGLANHIDVNARARQGATALTGAATIGSVEITRMLLDAGADANAVTNPATAKVKNGTVATGHFTPLIMAAPYAPSAVTKLLLEHGAKVDPVDDRGMTALHAAVASESPNVETVRLLLSHGADAGFRNTRGESARDWARKFPRPEVLTLVGLPAPVSAKTVPNSASGSLAPAEAYARGMALLERTSGNFIREGGCVACHSQNITGMAAGIGRANGLRPSPEATQERLRVTALNWASQAEGLLVREDGPGAAANVVSSLHGLAGDGYKPDLITAAMARNCAAQQGEDGAWRRLLGVARVPTEDSAIGLTAEVVHALTLFSGGGTKAEYDKRIERARRWLLTATPTYAGDANYLLLGLKWSGASDSAVAKAARTVAAGQRSSGGWAQRENFAEDAYATGQALYALHEAGMAASDPIYRKGAAFLLRTQAPDGSWHIASRSVKFQPYFESGFPYEHDQWISMSGTAWAAMALAISAGEGKERPALAASMR